MVNFGSSITEKFEVTQPTGRSALCEDKTYSLRESMKTLDVYSRSSDVFDNSNASLQITDKNCECFNPVLNLSLIGSPIAGQRYELIVAAKRR
jgi:hypothetical protein